MEKLLLSVFAILLVNVVSFPVVISQQQQVPQLVSHQPVAVPVNHQPHQQSQQIPDNVIAVPLDTSDAPVTNHYPYQSTSLAPSNYHQSYPGSYGSRDVSGPPFFAVTGQAGYDIFAYFGPVFWFVVIFFAVFGLCVGVSRLFMGTELFGGMLQRAKEATGRSLDLDNITNMVYQALDTYGKYAAKQARSGEIDSMKG